MPDHSKDPELLELVKNYKVRALSRTCCESRVSYGRYVTEKTIHAKPLDSKLSNDEKEEVLTWRNTLLKQVRGYIDNNLNPAKVKVIDPIKGNFTQPLSVQEILDELEISKVDYYRTFSISKDEDLELHLKRQPNSCFVKYYIDVGSKVWQANMAIQSV